MLDAAERVFASRGFRGASMDEIAAECGVTKPMLYAYFGSKEELFAACGIPRGERLRARLRATVAEGSADPSERLWRAFRTIFARVADNRETWRLLYPPEGPAPGGALGAHAAMNRRAMTELVTELLREAAAEEGVGADAMAQLEPLAHALVGAALGLASWSVAHPEEPSDVQALRLMNLVWKGFEALQQGQIWMPAEWR